MILKIKHIFYARTVKENLSRDIKIITINKTINAPFVNALF